LLAQSRRNRVNITSSESSTFGFHRLAEMHVSR
jgi:hypothetical protein